MKVWYTGRRREGEKIYHTESNCPHLERANEPEGPTDIDEIPDGWRKCNYCEKGPLSYQTNMNHAPLAKELDEISPKELGLTPIGERK